MRNADLRQIALLCELLDAQSLHTAASRMGMSPSAASQALQRLRGSVGEPIYVRHQGRYVPTPSGRNILDALREINAIWRRTRADLEAFDPAAYRGAVVVACSEGFIRPSPAALLDDVMRSAPLLQLDVLLAHNGPADVDALRRETVDLVVGLYAPLESDDDIMVDTLTQVHMTHVCLSAKHPRIGHAIDIDRYAQEQHVFLSQWPREGHQRAAIDQALLGMGYEPRRRSVVQSLSACAEALETTECLLTSSADVVQALMRMKPGLKALPLPDELMGVAVDVHLMWHQRSEHQPMQRWIRQRWRDRIRHQGLNAPPAPEATVS